MNKNRGKILWIDDEIDLLKPHILFLEEKGYSITKCNNGKEGISEFNQNIFDLVFLHGHKIETFELGSKCSLTPLFGENIPSNLGLFQELLNGLILLSK